MTRKPKVGDLFEIPLSDGRNAYGQYLHYSKMGPIIQVFDLITDREVTVEQIVSSKPLFPPVITGLYAAVKEGYWKITGYQPISNFIHPKFVSTLYDQQTGMARIWFLWDGERDIRIGPELRPEYKSLEFLVVWNPQDVVNRIETGKIPFPYAELIQNNKFTPRNVSPTNLPKRKDERN
jgi:hypothetical protein